MLLGVTRYAGSIPSELGSLNALQELDLDDNELTGESNMCSGVLGILNVKNQNCMYLFEKPAGNLVSSYSVRLTPLFPARRQFQARLRYSCCIPEVTVQENEVSPRVLVGSRRLDRVPPQSSDWNKEGVRNP